MAWSNIITITIIIIILKCIDCDDDLACSSGEKTQNKTRTHTYSVPNTLFDIAFPFRRRRERNIKAARVHGKKACKSVEMEIQVCSLATVFIPEWKREEPSF